MGLLLLLGPDPAPGLLLCLGAQWPQAQLEDRAALAAGPAATSLTAASAPWLVTHFVGANVFSVILALVFGLKSFCCSCITLISLHFMVAADH